MCPELADAASGTLREIRLRAGQKALLRTADGDISGKTVLTAPDLSRAAQSLSGHALPIYARQIASGFIPLTGGHRLGVCGRMYWDGEMHLQDISSLCVRVAHQVRSAGDALFPLVRGKSALVLGAPGAGKTTLLRELARLSAQDGAQVAIADERGEIAACAGGMPQLDVGAADVLTDCEKSRAMRMLVRGMAPDIIVTDELGDIKDARAALDARASGVRLYCSAHAKNAETLCRREGFSALIRQGAFDVIVELSVPGGPFIIRKTEEIPHCVSCLP